MARATRKKTTKKPKPVTLSEFKAWLEGVEELQPEGWHPDASQWELVRDKMLSIIEPEYDAVPVPKQQAPVHTNPQPAPVQPYNEVVEDMPQIIPGPPMQSSALPMDVEPANISMTPAAKAMLSGRPLPGTPGPDGKVKTPNIDTSNGSYTTSFE